MGLTIARFPVRFRGHRALITVVTVPDVKYGLGLIIPDLVYFSLLTVGLI